VSKALVVARYEYILNLYVLDLDVQAELATVLDKRQQQNIPLNTPGVDHNFTLDVSACRQPNYVKHGGICADLLSSNRNEQAPAEIKSDTHRTGLGKFHATEGHHNMQELVQDKAEMVLPTGDTGDVMHRSPGRRDISDDPSSSSDSGSASSDEIRDRTSSKSDGESNRPSDECKVKVGDALNSALNVVKHLLLQELLDHASSNGADVAQSMNDSPGESAGTSASSSLTSSSVYSPTLKGTKRAHGSGRDPDDNDDGDDSNEDDPPRKKGGKGPPNRFSVPRRLKCPFYQREPTKYNKAACRGAGFTDMAKLKDHIKRIHTQPLRCLRCWLKLESDDAYLEHQQQEIACLKRAKPQEEEDRILPQLLKRLNFKKAPYSNAHGIEAKWRMLFKVLFPDDQNVPSPCKSESG
jgi:hypothetical protein